MLHVYPACPVGAKHRTGVKFLSRGMPQPIPPGRLGRSFHWGPMLHAPPLQPPTGRKATPSTGTACQRESYNFMDVPHFSLAFKSEIRNPKSEIISLCPTHPASQVFTPPFQYSNCDPMPYALCPMPFLNPKFLPPWPDHGSPWY